MNQLIKEWINQIPLEKAYLDPLTILETRKYVHTYFDYEEYKIQTQNQMFWAIFHETNDVQSYENCQLVFYQRWIQP